MATRKGAERFYRRKVCRRNHKTTLQQFALRGLLFFLDMELIVLTLFKQFSSISQTFSIYAISNERYI